MLYADPGSGAMIWQLLLALFFGATFYFSRFKTWIAARLNDRRKSKQPGPIETRYSNESLPSATEGE